MVLLKMQGRELYFPKILVVSRFEKILTVLLKSV